MSEKSSLLRPSITTDEVRYDYSTTPSHNLKGAIPTKLQELEWKELDKDIKSMMGIELEFDKHVETIRNVQEMEHDSGIESNDHDDCDLSLSQVPKI